MNYIYLISGACGCGKSTLSKELARKIDHSFLIGGDELHAFFSEKDDVPWLERLRITWENICSVTQNALRNHLNVIIDYVVEEELPLLQSYLEDNTYELRYLVILPSDEVIKARITTRGDIELIDRALFLRNKLSNIDSNIQHIYDNSEKSVEETIKAFLSEDRFIVSGCQD
ncbi:MAG: hypothetical protein K0S47_3958 [Herbinix sp.]|jgi:2-phosphoglycerate kinase|nr:hypothetical protein [Herbinix sp.]